MRGLKGLYIDPEIDIAAKLLVIEGEDLKVFILIHAN